MEHASHLGLLVGSPIVRSRTSVSKGPLVLGIFHEPKVKFTAKLDRTGSNVSFRVD